jgi:hypothetical protein
MAVAAIRHSMMARRLSLAPALVSSVGVAHTHRSPPSTAPRPLPHLPPQVHFNLWVGVRVLNTRQCPPPRLNTAQGHGVYTSCLRWAGGWAGPVSRQSPLSGAMSSGGAKANRAANLSTTAHAASAVAAPSPLDVHTVLADPMDQVSWQQSGVGDCVACDAQR